MRIRVRGNSEIYKKKFGSLGAQGRELELELTLTTLTALSWLVKI